MNKKKLNSIIILWAFINVLFFSVVAYKCSQHNFLKTTGFYFSGLSFNEISGVKALGFDKNRQFIRNINCYIQYRLTDDYIFDQWRFDFVYYDFVDSIVLKVPDTLLFKIEKVWYKYDNTVTVFSGAEFVQKWPHKKVGINTYFFIPEYLIQKSSFYDGILCLIYIKGPLFRGYRYFMLVSFIFFVLLVFIRFKSVFKRLIMLLGRAGNYIYLKYRGLFRRFFVFFLGLLFLFLILETMLRIVGYIHNAKHIESQYRKTVNSKDVIICVGDSFTESFGSRDGSDYPSQFERIINKHLTSPVDVFNFGRSGKNTAQILLEVPLYIKNYKPRLIVLMAGSANYWNYWGYKEKESVFYKLRSVNFFRLLFQGIKDKVSKSIFDSEEYISRRNNYILSADKIDTIATPLIKLMRLQDFSAVNNYTDSCLKSNQLSETDILNLFVFSKLTGNKAIIDTTLRKIKTKSVATRFYLLLLGDSSANENLSSLQFLPFYRSVYYYLEEMKASKFSEERMKECIKLNPYFEDPYFQYYSMGHKDISTPDDYDQKRFSIIDTMNYYYALLGVEGVNNVFKQAYIDESIEEKHEKNKIDNWVSDDIENIINMCKQNGIAVVLMNYPIKDSPNLFSSVNEVLRNIAFKNNIPFVDNEFIFNNITKDKDSYYISDGHCSDKGLELMSQNLYKIVTDHKMLENK